MDRGELVTLDGATLVDGFTNDVHDTPEGGLADGDHDGSTRVNDLGTTYETLGTIHSNGSDRVFTQVGSDLENETTAMEVLDLKGVEDGGEVVGVELHIDDGTDDSLHSSDVLGLSSIAADSWGRRNA